MAFPAARMVAQIVVSGATCYLLYRLLRSKTLTWKNIARKHEEGAAETSDDDLDEASEALYRSIGQRSQSIVDGRNDGRTSKPPMSPIRKQRLNRHTLLKAAAKGDTERVRQLITDGTDVDANDVCLLACRREAGILRAW